MKSSFRAECRRETEARPHMTSSSLSQLLVSRSTLRGGESADSSSSRSVGDIGADFRKSYLSRTDTVADEQFQVVHPSWPIIHARTFFRVGQIPKPKDCY